MKRWIRPLAGLVVTAACVWLAFGRLSWPDVRLVIVRADARLLLLAVMLLAADLGMRIVRWWLMLRTVNPTLPLRMCVRPFVVSMALNNTMPLRAGDVVRSVAFGEALRTSSMGVVGTLLIERILDMAVLVALFFAGLLSIPGGMVPRALVLGGAMLGSAVVLAVIVLVVAPSQLQRAVMWVLQRPMFDVRPVTARLRAGASQLFEMLGLLRSPRLAAQLTSLSVMAWLLEGGVFAAVSRALQTGGSRFGAWFACATGTLATLIPSSPGYVGTFDYFIIQAMRAGGVDGTAAAAFALMVHVVLWLPVTMVGLSWLAVSYLRRAPRRAMLASDAS